MGKKRIFLLLSFLLCTVNLVTLYAQTYDSMWKIVEEDTKKDLPQQIIKHTQSIYNKAVKEKNFPQMMKAWIYMAETKCDIDADSFNIALFPSVEYANPTEEAIYNVIKGSAYLAMRDASTMDFDDTSKANHMDDVEKYFDKALADKAALAKENSKDYVPLIVLGKDSRFYGNDLLSVIVRFVCDHTTRGRDYKIQILDDAAEFYKQQSNMEAWALMSLSSMEQRRSGMTAKQYMSAIKQLLDKTKDLEAGADVAAEYMGLLGDLGRPNLSTAYDERLLFARWAQKQFSTSELKNIFVNAELEIMTGSCTLNSLANSIADVPFDFSLKYRNITEVSMEVRKYAGKDKDSNLRTNGKLIVQRQYTLATDSTCKARIVQNMPFEGSMIDKLTLPAGCYVIIFKSGGKEFVSQFTITSLQIINLKQPDDTYFVTVVKGSTGRPVAGATLNLKNNTKKVVRDVVCDSEGCYEFDPKGITYLSASISDDDKTNDLYIHDYSRQRNEKHQPNCKLYTDRSIYRPGQVVHVAGIIYDNAKDNETSVMSDVDATLMLYDINSQMVDKKTVRSNEWGTIDADFTLPKDRLTGSFNIRVEIKDLIQYCSFSVEEYKRPTFDVMAISADKGKELAFGDSVNVVVNSKMFSGVPVQGAKVKYTISSSRVTFRTWYNPFWEEESKGELQTDDEGNAKITVKIAADEVDAERNRVVRYRLTAEVTDIAGETHSANYYVSVSKLGFSLNAPILAAYDASTHINITVKANNANNEEVKAEGEYTINNMKGNELYSNKFNTNKPIVIPSLPMGTYKIIFKSIDHNGNDVTWSSQFDLYDSEAAIDPRTKMAAPITDFDYDFKKVVNNQISETQQGEILFAPKEDDIYAFYAVMSNNSVIERKCMILGKHLYRFKIKYKKEYGDGVKVMLGYVRNGHKYMFYETLTYVLPDKKLNLSWKTFRDKLVPGQKEEWILTAKDKNGKIINAAEMMATMFDASLDKLKKHDWFFKTFFPRFVYTGSLNMGVDWPIPWLSLSLDPQYFDVTAREFNQLIEFNHNRRDRRMTRFAKVVNGIKMIPKMNEFEGLGMVSVDEALQGRIAGLDLVMNSGNLGAGIKKEESRATIRSNFAETAFFYPHLTADSKGDVHISFTLPESLTQWRLLGIVHTKDVQYGMIDTTVVARKDFMIQPNMPRFVREGDKVSISSRVINQGEKVVDGNVRILLIDPETDLVVFKDNKHVNVESGKTESVAFEFAVTDKYPLLICEITAESDNISDGERNYLPVLTSKKYITETVPFYINKGESKTVDLHELFNNNSVTATNKRMTLEFTTNPSWTVIEALEGIKLPENNNAPCFAASLYANIMASRLVQSIPGFRAVLSSQPKDSTCSTLNSTLSDSESLKDILLRESPWVLDAINETNQRNALLDLFDGELMAQRIDIAKQKLVKLQNTDGSWSWFEGMDGSCYITMSVCENLALLASNDVEIINILEKGIAYLDKVELKEYNEMMKRKKSLLPSETDLQYLYVSSLLADRKVGRDIMQMREDYLKRLEKNMSSLTIYGRATAACVLRAFGHTKKADELLQSVVEYTISKPGMGRYYATDIAYYSWRDYRIPTHLAAMRAIKHSSLPDKRSLLADMQIWLLRQRQTQTWDNPMNTIDAVSFLMDNSDDSLTGVVPSFKINNVTVEASIDTARFIAEQLGYIKTKISDEVISKGANVLSVVSPTLSSQPSSISWGAVYVQYLEDVEKLRDLSSGELKITRCILVDGKDFNTNSSTLSVGDKVTVRLTITADRDMDFVQVRSQHPACFEPVIQLSGYRWMGGRGGYVAMHDASADVFFDCFKKGTTTFDLEFYVTRKGDYFSGIATAQCAYAPEFVSHTKGDKVTVSNNQ